MALFSASPIPAAQYGPQPQQQHQQQQYYTASASQNFPQVTPAKRQSGYGYPQPSNPELDSAAQTFGDGSFARPSSGGRDQFGGGGNSGGGNRNVRCSRVPSSSGPDAYKFQCEIIRKEDITLKYEHILWLAGSAGGSAPAVEIVVPNYRVEEIIKAGFKGGSSSGGKQPINILLQRPEKTVAAEVDQLPGPGKIEPEVNIQYEPATNTQVHYPNDQAYRPLSGPILPPARD